MLATAFRDSYRIYKEVGTKGASVEIGDQRQPFLHESIRHFFQTETDARIAVELVQEVLALVDRFNDSVYDKLIDEIGDVKLDEILTAAFDKAREPRIKFRDEGLSFGGRVTAADLEENPF